MFTCDATITALLLQPCGPPWIHVGGEMMADAPAYTTVPGKIPTLLQKMREVGVPSKATRDWLKSLGLKSSNDPTLIPVLRQIGFIDAAGVPQPAWKQYRGADYKKVLGRAIRQGYEDLYRTYE